MIFLTLHVEYFVSTFFPVICCILYTIFFHWKLFLLPFRILSDLSQFLSCHRLFYSYLFILVHVKYVLIKQNIKLCLLNILYQVNHCLAAYKLIINDVVSKYPDVT